MKLLKVKNDNWDLIKLLYYSKTFYPEFDMDHLIMEQCLMLSDNRDVIYMLYLSRLLNSIDGIKNVPIADDFKERVLCFRLDSYCGEEIYEIINRNVDIIKEELYDNCCLEYEDDEALEFVVSFYESTSQTAYEIVRNAFKQDFFTGLEDFIYINFYEGEEVNIYIHIDLNVLIPDNVENMLPLEQYIRFIKN